MFPAALCAARSLVWILALRPRHPGLNFLRVRTVPTPGAPLIRRHLVRPGDGGGPPPQRGRESSGDQSAIESFTEMPG